MGYVIQYGPFEIGYFSYLWNRFFYAVFKGGLPSIFYHVFVATRVLLQCRKRQGEKRAGAENGKKELFQSEWHQGVYDPGAFKLDHLQPVKQILFQNISHFYPISNSKPIIFTPETGMEEEAGLGLNMRKGNSPKVNETQGLLTLGQSNWTICSLLNRFCSKIFPIFTLPPIINQFSLLQRQGGRKEQGWGWTWEKGTL